MPMIESHILTQADESVARLLAQGWDQSGPMYELLPGDAEALAARLGREPTRKERVQLELAIRRLILDTPGAVPVSKFMVEHDDQPDQVVESVSEALAMFGLEIAATDGSDGVQWYAIRRIK